MPQAITITLDQNELTALMQLMDAAARYLGRGACKTVAVFEGKIEVAVAAFNAEECAAKVAQAVADAKAALAAEASEIDKQ